MPDPGVIERDPLDGASMPARVAQMTETLGVTLGKLREYVQGLASSSDAAFETIWYADYRMNQVLPEGQRNPIYDGYPLPIRDSERRIISPVPEESRGLTLAERRAKMTRTMTVTLAKLTGHVEALQQGDTPYETMWHADRIMNQILPADQQNQVYADWPWPRGVPFPEVSGP